VAAVVEAEAAVAAVAEAEAAAAAAAAVAEAEAAVAVPATTTPAGPTLFASGTQADRGDRSSPSVPSNSAPSDMASSNWLLWALSVGATTDPAAGAPEGNWLWAVVDGNAPIRVSAADVLALESVQGSTGNWKLVEPGKKFVGTADISTLLGPPDGGRYWAASARHEVVTVYDCIPASDAFTTS
jgi:hypothetical protein